MLQEPPSVRLRESLRVFPVLFQGPASPIRESVRPFRGVARASKFSFARVLERCSTPFGAIQTFTAPAFRSLKAALPPRLRFHKNAKRFCQALEMLCRRRNTVKIGILAVFGPKPWTPPRRAENGPPALFDHQPNGRVWDARPESRFPGFSAFVDGHTCIYIYIYTMLGHDRARPVLVTVLHMLEHSTSNIITYGRDHCRPRPLLSTV